jgi:hypothetical protein
MAAVNANALSSDISRRNPQDEYELIQRIGSGTYGDVYKVGIDPRLDPPGNDRGETPLTCVSSPQAKRLSMNDLAAIKVIKLEPGECDVHQVCLVSYGHRNWFLHSIIHRFFALHKMLFLCKVLLQFFMYVM